jgi:hypothetical protein
MELSAFFEDCREHVLHQVTALQGSVLRVSASRGPRALADRVIAFQAGFFVRDMVPPLPIRNVARPLGARYSSVAMTGVRSVSLEIWVVGALRVAALLCTAGSGSCADAAAGAPADPPVESSDACTVAWGYLLADLPPDVSSVVDGLVLRPDRVTSRGPEGMRDCEIRKVSFLCERSDGVEDVEIGLGGRLWTWHNDRSKGDPSCEQRDKHGSETSPPESGADYSDRIRFRNASAERRRLRLGLLPATR